MSSKFSIQRLENVCNGSHIFNIKANSKEEFEDYVTECLETEFKHSLFPYYHYNNLYPHLLAIVGLANSPLVRKCMRQSNYKNFRIVRLCRWSPTAWLYHIIAKPAFKAMLKQKLDEDDGRQ